MANYIQPILLSITGILQKYTPDLMAAADLDPFVDYGMLFTGVVPNFPAVWVQPLRTQFDDEGQTLKEKHFITVKFGITADEPDVLVTLAMAYMKVITEAIYSADWSQDWQGGIVPNRLLVVINDFGPVFVKQGGGGFARFPEAHIEIEVEEVWTNTK